MPGEPLDVPLKRLDPDLPPLTHTRPGDAAVDLPAASPATLPPGQRVLVPTGFAVAIPSGHCGLVLPRSGLALKFGLTVLNAPGLVDPGYRGELKVILVNHGQETVHIERGQRIAQLLIVALPVATLTEQAQLPPGPDDRGAQGFGSSG